MFQQTFRRLRAAADFAHHGQAALQHANHHYGENGGFGNRCHALRVLVRDFILGLMTHEMRNRNTSDARKGDA
jgi:hypothetical protein